MVQACGARNSLAPPKEDKVIEDNPLTADTFDDDKDIKKEEKRHVEDRKFILDPLI